MFYNKFLERFDKCIYDDYDKLNASLIKKYDIAIPSEISEIVKKREGEPIILNEEDICQFIDFVGNLDIRSLVKQDTISIKKKFEDIQISIK